MQHTEAPPLPGAGPQTEVQQPLPVVQGSRMGVQTPLTHAPFWQIFPEVVQLAQVPPPLPQALSAVPGWQLPRLSQQPQALPPGWTQAPPEVQHMPAWLQGRQALLTMVVQGLVHRHCPLTQLAPGGQPQTPFVQQPALGKGQAAARTQVPVVAAVQQRPAAAQGAQMPRRWLGGVWQAWQPGHWATHWPPEQQPCWGQTPVQRPPEQHSPAAQQAACLPVPQTGRPESQTQDGVFGLLASQWAPTGQQTCRTPPWPSGVGGGGPQTCRPGGQIQAKPSAVPHGASSGQQAREPRQACEPAGQQTLTLSDPSS